MAEQRVFRYVFGWKGTAKGGAVWMEGPNGRRQTRRFRSKQSGVDPCARGWVQLQCRNLREEAALRDFQVEFEIPEELQSVTESRRVTLSNALWDAIDAAAAAQHKGVSSWLSDAAQAALSKESGG